MRGEDCSVNHRGIVNRGSPPHARGRQNTLIQIGQFKGITPACAGKTQLALHFRQ